jgi:hypothetical protein
MIRFLAGLHSSLYIQGEAIVYDCIHIYVVMNWVEYKTHKKLGIVSSKMNFNIPILVLTSYIS